MSADRLELRLGTYAYSLATAASKAIRAGEIARCDYFAATRSRGGRDLQRLKQDRTIYSVRR